MSNSEQSRPDHNDTCFSRTERYSVGIDKLGRRYLSIPVSNGALDYEEYYEITPDQYDEFLADTSAAVDFADSCRRREQDRLLLQKPGWNRGTPV